MLKIQRDNRIVIRFICIREISILNNCQNYKNNQTYNFLDFWISKNEFKRILLVSLTWKTFCSLCIRSAQIRLVLFSIELSNQ